MKIVKRMKEVITFSDLTNGDVFVYCGDLYIKVGTSISECNAYNLQDNVLELIFGGEKVKPIQAELIIK